MNSMGSITIAAAAAACFHRRMEKPYVLISFDTARAVANLANSAGCRRSGPKTSHEREPLISWGLNMVAKSSSKSMA